MLVVTGLQIADSIYFFYTLRGFRCFTVPKTENWFESFRCASCFSSLFFVRVFLALYCWWIATSWLLLPVPQNLLSAPFYFFKPWIIHSRSQPKGVTNPEAQKERKEKILKQEAIAQILLLYSPVIFFFRPYGPLLNNKQNTNGGQVLLLCQAQYSVLRTRVTPHS